jgi:hypothetical protein
MINSGTFAYRTQFSYLRSVQYNTVINATVFINPIIFPVNFENSVAYCATPPSSIFIVNILLNNENIGTVTFVPGNNYGSFETPLTFVNTNDVLIFSSSANSNIEGLSFILNGDEYIAPITIETGTGAFFSSTFTLNQSQYYSTFSTTISGKVYPENTNLQYAISDSNVAPTFENNPATFYNCTTTGNTWSASINTQQTYLLDNEFYIWVVFESNPDIYKISPFFILPYTVSIISITQNGSNATSVIQDSSIIVSGEVIPSGQPVQIATSPSNNIAPTSGFVAANVTGNNWTANLTLSSVGTFYIWAEQTNNTSITTVSQISIIVDASFSVGTITNSGYFANNSNGPIQFYPGYEAIYVVNASEYTDPIQIGYSGTNNSPSSVSNWIPASYPYNAYFFGNYYEIDVYSQFTLPLPFFSPRNYYLYAEYTGYPNTAIVVATFTVTNSITYNGTVSGSYITGGTTVGPFGEITPVSINISSSNSINNLQLIYYGVSSQINENFFSSYQAAASFALPSFISTTGTLTIAGTYSVSLDNTYTTLIPGIISQFNPLNPQYIIQASQSSIFLPVSTGGSTGGVPDNGQVIVTYFDNQGNTILLEPYTVY